MHFVCVRCVYGMCNGGRNAAVCNLCGQHLQQHGHGQHLQQLCLQPAPPIAPILCPPLVLPLLQATIQTSSSWRTYGSPSTVATGPWPSTYWLSWLRTAAGSTLTTRAFSSTGMRK